MTYIHLKPVFGQYVFWYEKKKSNHGVVRFLGSLNLPTGPQVLTNPGLVSVSENIFFAQRKKNFLPFFAGQKRDEEKRERSHSTFQLPSMVLAKKVLSVHFIKLSYCSY